MFFLNPLTAMCKNQQVQFSVATKIFLCCIFTSPAFLTPKGSNFAQNFFALVFKKMECFHNYELFLLIHPFIFCNAFLTSLKILCT